MEKHVSLRSFAALLIVCLAAITSLRAEEFVPPAIRAAHFSHAPKIDAVLDDECWKTCERITGFVEIVHGQPAAHQTEAMVCCDSAMLYVAFVCYDPQPELIHAQQKQRNSDLASDDWVEVLIDAMHNHLDHYHFTVNPAGTQSQSVPTGSAANTTWRGDWPAAAKITEDGWVAEMAIPFDGLRYPNRATTFGIFFRRYIPRSDERSCWPNAGELVDQNRFADLIELKLPRQAGRPVLMPFTVMSTEPGRSFSQTGFDFKDELPNGIIGMMTYNPDFTDVQDAVASLSYSYTERFLPEQRPFFQEGAEHVNDSLAFYSRRIGAVDWGAKVFGHTGRHAFAFVNALSRGRDNHFASQYVYHIDPNTGAGFLFTGSTVRQQAKEDPTEPDQSMCFSPVVWKNWRDAGGTTSISVRNYKSMNSGAGDGSAWRASLTRTPAAGKLGYSLAYEDTDWDYYVRDAYIPLTGVKGYSGALRYHQKPVGSKVTYWDTYITGRRRTDKFGDMHDNEIALGASFQTRSEWSVGTYFSKGEWLGEEDSTTMLQVGWLTRHLYGGGSLGVSTGKRAGEDYEYAWVDQNFRLTPRVSLTCGFEWTSLGGPGGGSDSQFTVLGNYEITPERNVGVWMVGRGSDINTCLTYKQTVRSGSDVYLIYGYPNTRSTEQRIALKIVRPMTW